MGGLKLTDEGFVVCRALWNIGGKLRNPWRELVCEDAGILERGNVSRTGTCRGNDLQGKREELEEVGL